MKTVNLKNLYSLLGIVAVLILIWLIWSQLNSTTYYSDTTVNENYKISTGETVTLKDGANLIVQGDLLINGTLKCENGPINLEVDGDINVNGKIECYREYIGEEEVGSSINIVGINKILFSKGSEVLANSHIQITHKKSDLAKTRNKIGQIFNKTQRDDGEGSRIGPLVNIPTNPNINNQSLDLNASLIDNHLLNLVSEKAYAQEKETNENVLISGRWILGSPSQNPVRTRNVNPPEGIEQVLLDLNFSGDSVVKVANAKFYGPNGIDGNSDIQTSCTTNGEDGGDGFRMGIQGKRLIIDNVEINLGNGGNGGNAVTTNNCENAEAVGGNGGLPGNFKLIGKKGIDVIGKLEITPGKAGNGGNAFAYGKQQETTCESTNGGNAVASAGHGNHNQKGIKIEEPVKGSNLIHMNRTIGGNGGNAVAEAGKGSDASECSCEPGNGGNAVATGGNGGHTSSTSFESQGGNGGNTTAVPGNGGNAFVCNEEPGQNGGNGGSATVIAGAPGRGLTEFGLSGEIKNAKGGNGGEGASGCEPGLGGEPGTGLPEGYHGKNGESTCETKKETQVFPMKFNKLHARTASICPNEYVEKLRIDVPESQTWEVTQKPAWIDFEQIKGQGLTEIELSYDCTIEDLGEHIGIAKVETGEENINIEFSLKIIE